MQVINLEFLVLCCVALDKFLSAIFIFFKNAIPILLFNRWCHEKPGLGIAVAF